MKDKSSDKYPGCSFYAGRWRTPEQIAVYDISNQRYKQSEKGRATRREIFSPSVTGFACSAREGHATLMRIKEFALRLREERDGMPVRKSREEEEVEAALRAVRASSERRACRTSSGSTPSFCLRWTNTRPAGLVERRQTVVRAWSPESEDQTVPSSAASHASSVLTLNEHRCS